jgi:hypothetical protein
MAAKLGVQPGIYCFVKMAFFPQFIQHALSLVPVFAIPLLRNTGK